MSENKTIDCIIQWLKIREENGIKFPKTLDRFYADVEHSALLKRLLDGKEALPKPPPVTFSYPNYNLIEHGKGAPFDVWKPTDKQNIFDMDCVIIDQSAWRLVKEIGQDDWEVEWPKREGEIWHVWADGWTDGSALDSPPVNGVAHKTWKMEKL